MILPVLCVLASFVGGGCLSHAVISDPAAGLAKDPTVLIVVPVAERSWGIWRAQNRAERSLALGWSSTGEEWPAFPPGAVCCTEDAVPGLIAESVDAEPLDAVWLPEFGEPRRAVAGLLASKGVRLVPESRSYP